jgi:hypothetical protein
MVMQILLCWDINAEGTKATDIETALRAVLKSYSWVRPLETVYMIRLEREDQKDALQKALLDAAQPYMAEVNYLITPIMTGRFDGLLPATMWPELNS